MSRAIANSIVRDHGEDYDVILLFEALYSPGIGDELCKPYVIYEDATFEMARRNWSLWAPSSSNKSEYRSLESSLYQKASAIFTSNELARKSLIRDYSIPEGKVVKVGQGCSFSFNNRRKKKPNGKKLLFVGYDFKRKGGYLLLQAFEKVKAKIHDAELTIVGTKLAIKQSGINFLGRVRDHRRLMQIYDESLVFVLPSFFDPMPHAAVEAMSRGLVVVTSDGCGTAELIFFVSFMIIGLYSKGSISKRHLIIFGLCLLLIYFSGIFSKFSYESSTLFTRRTSTVDDRLNIMAVTLRMFSDKPILGFGYGNYEKYNDKYFVKMKDIELRGEGEGNHNTILGLLAEIGIVGTFPYIMIFYFFIQTAVRFINKSRKKSDFKSNFGSMYLSILIGYIAGSQFYDVRFFNMMNSMVFCLSGVLFSLNEEKGLTHNIIKDSIGLSNK